MTSWSLFLMIFARMAGMVFLFPYFSWRGIPVMLRVFITVLLSFLVFLALGNTFDFVPPAGPETVFVLGGEVIVGLAIGYLVVVFFAVFMMGGEMVSRQAGLMFARVFDPTFGGQSNILGQFYMMLAIVFYLTINGHHLLIRALMDSYTLIPPGFGLSDPALSGSLVRLTADALIISFKIVAPIMIVLLIFNIALGLVAKTVPQIHIFILSLPVKILGSWLLLLATFPFLIRLFENLLEWILGFMYQFMQGWTL